MNAALEMLTLSPVLLAFLACASVALLMAGVFANSRPSLVDARLGPAGRVMHNLEDLELSQPFVDRVIRPMMRQVSRLVQSRMPQSQIDDLRRRLMVAGNPGGLEMRDFLGIKGLVAV